MARAAAVPQRRRPGTRPARAPNRRKQPRGLGRSWLIRLGLFALLVVGLAAGWTYAATGLIDLNDPSQVQRRPSVTLLARDGAPIASTGDVYGAWLSLDEMSPWLPKAIVAVEDRRFFDHPGIDPLGIGRALWRNLQAGRVVEGGSTITQQLAKLAFLDPDRSWSRKAREAVYAVWLEVRYDKDELLEAYLNRIYLGGGAYGVDGAARRYFGKSAREVSLPEAAMLAGLIRGPSLYAPTRDLERARERAKVALAAMVDAGAITEAQAEAARAAPASLAGGAGSGARYFADWIFAATQDFAGEAHPDVRVQTTLDLKRQRIAQRALASVMDARGAAGRAGEAALVAMTPEGEILAMVGGRDYATSQYNRATQARRQPGSAFKLFVYLAALEAGVRPDDPLSGAPIRVGRWQPTNLGGAYPEQLTVGESFARSVNTAAVRLAEQVGRGRVAEAAHRLGITSNLGDAPSLSLGAAETTLMELTGAYATVLGGGRLAWPNGLSAVTTRDGAVLYRHAAVHEQVVDPAVAATMVGLLRQVVTSGTGRGAQPADGRPVAGKTGTSSEHRDAWFVGFSAGVVVGVWVGNDDGTPMQGVTGASLPAEIFRRFVVEAESGEAARSLVAPAPVPKPSVVARRGGSDTESMTLDEAGQALERVVDDVLARISSWLGQ